ncbi:MAG: histidine phosphatase family protein [Sphingomonas bacterium]|nr:histidine phosphatase family protein [Sphingomonas bacterium]
MTAKRWPSVLWIVRHGESAGNVARDVAAAAGAHRIDLTSRDVDVPLSPRGEDQAEALGRWFAQGQEDGRPEVLMASPYARAIATAKHFRGHGGCAEDTPICCDERLREKEFGILDGLTAPGIAAVLPDQAEFRRLLGKFYHRPPGGESWCDVILRLRSVMDTVSLHHGGQRVMIVAHQVVVLCLRYIIEGLNEADILAIDREADVANCSITEYRFDPAMGQHGGLALARYNVTAPIEAANVPVTNAPEPIQGVRG